MALISDLGPKHPECGLVRLGPKSDGGYLVPNDLTDLGGCVSPGVSNESGFDLAIAELGIDVHMADATVSGPAVPHKRFKFDRRHLDTYKSDTTITLDEYCRPIAPGHDLILQMDIEGAEYRVLHSASDDLMARFRIMIVEFHSLAHLFSPFGLREIGSTFRKLLRTHNVVHIHPNNYGTTVAHGTIEIPPFMEFTFYRRDRSPLHSQSMTYPHPLDYRNVPDKPDVTLPACWHPAPIKS